MSRIITLTTEEGRTTSCEFKQIHGVSQSFVFFDMEQGDDVDYWRSFFEDYAVKITQHLLQHTTQISLRVSCTGQYERHDTGDISEPITMNSAHPARINRHANHERKIHGQFLAVHDPDEYYMRLQENFGSNIGTLELYHSFSMTFEFPYEYNARALPASYRLHKCELTDFLHYNPRNSDSYCVLHCLFAGKEQLHAGKSLNRNVAYMEAFNQWFQDHNLARFYIDGYFVLDNVEKLEKELAVNVNFYTFEDKLELFFRSSYLQEGEIFNLVVIPMKYFYDNSNSKGVVPEIVEGESPPLIHPITDLDEEFIANINIKNLVTKRNGHCALLDTAIFRDRKKDGHVRHNTAVCRYCTGNFALHKLVDHEAVCKTTFSESKRSQRIRVYQELRPDQVTKEFTAYHAQYQVCFCVYDFETRLDGEGRHIGFSYSIIYINVFDLSKSREKISSSQDPKELLEWFLEDVAEFAAHHHDLQCVDHADPAERAAAEIPADGICPFCLKETPRVETVTKQTVNGIVRKEKHIGFEYNHSHFGAIDNLNKHLSRYICKICNLKCTLRQKPLKFYGHNASRFDNYLFTEALINSEKFTNFEFLAKTESRFTQIVCGVTANPKHKVSFNDSRMIVSGNLATLAKAWITPGVDDPKIKSLLKLFYPNMESSKLDTLVTISREKAVFPYSALNNEALHAEKVIAKEHFYDNLYNTEISEEDYQTYLKANSILEKTVGNSEEYSFIQYHDLYLALDCILLGLVLLNFFSLNTKNSGINPLWSLSVSSFSFSAMLFHNKYNVANSPQIKIPSVQVQKFLQKSIRGGYSQIFHKQIPNFNAKDLCFYVDFNSMYPSTMIEKLPYEFLRWAPVDDSVEEILRQLSEAGDEKYYFLEVDIDFLGEEFQDKCSKLPLFPENREIQPEWLSEDQKHRWKLNSKQEFEPTTINCTTFFEKKNYVCSFSYLKMALSQGYKVTKIHTIAEFKAGFVMSDYVRKIYGDKQNGSIEKNNLLKAIKVAEDSEKDTTALRAELVAVECRIACAKIQANGLFGACLISVDRHSETEMLGVEDTKTLKKRISSLRFKSLYQADQKVLVSSDKTQYQLSYPTSLGSAILWQSKIMMAKFVHTLYDFLQEKGLKMNVMMTDTDSLMIHVPNFHDVFSSYDQMTTIFNKTYYRVFDTSFNKPEYQDPTTHEELTFMKNESKNVPIIAFNGICSKVYSYVKADEKEVVKAKGVGEVLQKKHLTNALYRDVINGVDLDAVHTCEFGAFSANRLKVKNVRVTKKYVSLVDIKSWYGENGITPLVFGSAAHLAQIGQ